MSEVKYGWITYLVTVIIILAVGTGAYFLFQNEPEKTAAPRNTSGSLRSNIPDRISSKVMAARGNQVNIDNLKGFERKLSGSDLALLVFLRHSENLTKSDEAAIDLAISELNKKNIKLSKVFVREDGLGFDSGMKQLGLNRMPAVVTLGKYGKVVFSGGKISSENILKACDKVSSPPK